ncbi:MAG TPA: NAD-dependent DNA ligase LigA [Amoebophilaceae bacterium]|jgi:DNA ligase (NAD+)|nr:NAD-dependent DNA ligase LigA [Amoebophilaceae bacterium]
MHANDVQNEINRLVALIRYHNECYFQKGTTEISDYAYDQLLERLAQLERTYPHLKVPNSPTDVLGERPSNAFPTAYHQAPMLSLAKTYSEAEVVQFVNRMQKMVPGSSIHFVCELKIDGIALSLVYKEGQLVQVVTRGDGEKGDDITKNAVSLLPVMQKIDPVPAPSFEVRGEACLSKATFQALNEARAAAGEALFANPRNLAAGTLKTITLDLVKERRLNFYAYSFYALGHACTTHEAALRLLTTLGFTVTPGYQICHNAAEIMAYIHYWEKQKHTLPVEIDGIVVKVNNLAHQQLLGTTAKSPRWAIAYKHQPERNHSILKQVHYQVGRTGIVTPVACFEPILLAGTVVQRASLHNAAEMMRKDLHLGDTIFIEKGGDIIPQVVGVDPTKRTSTSRAVAFPATCPACDSPLLHETGEAAHYCPNTQACPPQLKANLLHFAHRKAMDIDGLGPKTIDALFDANLVRTPADLYALTYERVSTLEGFQATSSQKLLAAIEASKSKSFERVLFALGIKHIGETVSKKLALHFTNMDQLENATEADLLQLPDIGERIAQSIRQYVQDPYHRAILAGLQRAGLRFSLTRASPMVASKEGPLAAKSIVLSGTFQRYSREALGQRIAEAGGKLTTALSAKTDYLVAGHKAGPSKLTKASAWGIPIVEEDEIIQMMQL